MINWRDIRSVKELRQFSAQYQALKWGDKEPILQEMVTFLDEYKGFTEIIQKTETKNVATSRKKRRPRRARRP